MLRNIILAAVVSCLWGSWAQADDAMKVAKAQTTAPAASTSTATASTPSALPVETVAKIEPYRTFVTIQKFTMENNGEPKNPISNVRLTLIFPNGSKVNLPEGGQWWPIGNNQVQEINRTFEIPWAYIVADGFKFDIQMERKGSKMLPCQFDISQLSQFNRAYTCHTDVAWQQNQKVSEDKLDREGVTIRVFTSKNSLPKEIPTDAIALRPAK